jgi:hypothetical protein
MALVFCDGFDHYTTSLFTTKWDARGGSGDLTIGTSYRRGSTGQGLWWRYNSGEPNFRKDLPSNATYTFGLALQPVASIGADDPLISLRESGTTHISLQYDSSNHLKVVMGASTVLGTGSTVLQVSTWYYVELKVTINDSTGSFELRINGQTETSGSGVDTRNGGTGVIDNIYFTTAQFSSQYMDDFYVCDGSGSVNNSFLGDIKIETLYPSGAGTTTQFTPSTGSNYQNVDETTPNDDTDYNYTSTTGNKDTYAYADLATTAGIVYGVQQLIYARKDDAGTRTIAPVARSGGTDYDGSTVSLLDTYTYFRSVRDVNPNTSSGWTISEVNGAEFGVKLVS